MSDPRVNLKNPWVAAVLAFLLPGAGHLYQGRTFKGVLYFVCVFGTFVYGMHLADWRAVYAFAGEPTGRARQRVYGYFAQIGIGGPALGALVQAKRYQNPENQHLRMIEEKIVEPFEGVVLAGGGPLAAVEGQITLEPTMGRFGPDVKGMFEGTVTGEDGQSNPVRLRLEGSLELERPISADPRRRLEIAIVERLEGPESIESGQYLNGSIARPLVNWLQVPPEQAQIERLHRDFGRFFDLGMVYTWIAGLLNVLVIWDALEGPAYGYGDEEDEEEPEGAKQDKSKDAERSSAATAEATESSNGDGATTRQQRQAAR